MNINNLKNHLPPSVFAQIPLVIEKYKVETAWQLAHFLGQCAHESINFKEVLENLNYSAEGLKKTFPKYFPTSTLCNAYAHKPEAIASRVYARRMGNGDEASKEGWKYRGRGYIQLTGKDNYKAFSKYVEEDLLSDPDLVANKYPLASAAWFFDTKKVKYNDEKIYLIDLCNKGGESFVAIITKAVNGGVIGLHDRIKCFNRFYHLLKEQQDTPKVEADS